MKFRVFLRLSQEKEESCYFPLRSNSLFKVGEKELEIQDSNYEDFNIQECVLCRQSEKNCEYYVHDCKKFYFCEICGKCELNECPICQNLISLKSNDIGKINYLKLMN